jgi:hypothetical protein
MYVSTRLSHRVVTENRDTKAPVLVIAECRRPIVNLSCTSALFDSEARTSDTFCHRIFLTSPIIIM